jgi:hypothetical protein
MSMRQISIRPTDIVVREAFEIALSQLGFKYNSRYRMPYCTITGNKNSGVLVVETFDHSAHMYVHGRNEDCFFVDRVVFDVLNGKALEIPQKVEFANFSNDGISLQSRMVTHEYSLRTTIHHVLCLAVGLDLADHTLLNFEKYPLLEVVDGQYKYTYSLGREFSVSKVEIFYNTVFGYSKVVVYGKSTRTYFFDLEYRSWVEAVKA